MSLHHSSRAVGVRIVCDSPLPIDHRRLLARLSLALLALVCSSCAAQTASVGPETGIVTVGVSTTGTGVAGTMFAVEIAPGGFGGDIRADSGIYTAREVPAGDIVVRLTRVPNRCRVEGGPERTVSVSARRSATIRFVVTCAAR